MKKILQVLILVPLLVLGGCATTPKHPTSQECFNESKFVYSVATYRDGGVNYIQIIAAIANMNVPEKVKLALIDIAKVVYANPEIPAKSFAIGYYQQCME